MRSPFLLLAALLIQAGCDATAPLVAPEPGLERMIDQPRGGPYRADPVHPEEPLMRAPPPGTVARDGAPDGAIRNGIGPEGPLVVPPMVVDRAFLERGRERFAIMCAACHGIVGDGRTPVAERMTMVRPRDLHDPSVRAQPVGRIVQVIAEGYGLMPAHDDLLDIRDRWAVAAYVKVLQLSRHAVIDALPEPQRRRARERLP